MATASALVVFVFVIIGLLVVAAVTFGAWAVGRGIRTIFNGVFSLLGGPPHQGRYAARAGYPAALPSLRCPRQGCHADNVAAAKFCRRCGVAMDARQATPNRRPRQVAAW